MRCFLHRLAVLGLAALGLAVPAGLLALASPAAAERFTFAVIGDMPYDRARDEAAFANLTAAINAWRPAFTVHVGDFKSGRARCDDAAYAHVRQLFDRFDQPLIYTPGDNDWTDCHRRKAGDYDPIERLARLRAIFFPDAESLGRSRLVLQRQSSLPALAKFAENARWTMGGLVFATLHVVGSKDGTGRSEAGDAEQRERRAADLAWLADTFAEARRSAAPGVVLFMQASPHWGEEESAAEAPVYRDLAETLADAVITYGRPVLLAHGDRHRFRIDMPLPRGEGTLMNFTRLGVFGEHDIHGVLVHVDTDRPGLFAFEPLIVEANLTR